MPWQRPDKMLATAETIGIIAGILTTSSFLPQIFKAIKTRSAQDLSLWMIGLFITGIGLWLVYGILVNSIAIIGANIITLLFWIILLYLRLRYPKHLD